MKEAAKRNAKGYRIGESHPKSKLTDHEIDLIRELHDEGLGYRKIARKFEVDFGVIRQIVKCSRRAQLAEKPQSQRAQAARAKAGIKTDFALHDYELHQPTRSRLTQDEMELIADRRRRSHRDE